MRNDKYLNFSKLELLLVVIFVFISVSLCIDFCFSQTETLNITTYYPTPYGYFDSLILTPQASSSCIEGELFYDSNDPKGLYICGIGGSGQGTEQGGAVPSGAVVFFDIGTCPTGWTEFIQARGRYVLGVVNTGAVGTTVGTALSDEEIRPTGSHTHPGSAQAAGSHRHDLMWRYSNAGRNGVYGTYSWWNDYIIPAFSSGGSHNHSISGNTGYTGTGDTNAPYIQYVACQKD